MMVTASGLYRPTQLPRGALNATAYFQSVMTDVLNGRVQGRRLVFVDDLTYRLSEGCGVFA